LNKTIDAALELKELTDSGSFSGMASVFGELDSVNDIIEPGAFTKSLKDHREKDRMPALLWQHDTREPIGAIRDIVETSKGLEIKKADLFIDEIPKARQAHKLLKEKAISGLSIGFRLKDSEIDKSSGARLIKQVDLFEVSLVTFPALDSARVSNVKAAAEKLGCGEIPTERELEALLRDAGLSKKMAKTLMAGGYNGLDRRDADTEAEAIRELINKIAGDF